MIGFRRSVLLSASTAAFAVALSGGAQADVIPLPVLNPNFDVTGNTPTKDLWGNLHVAAWSETAAKDDDLTGISGPNQGTSHGPSGQPFAVYGTGTNGGGSFPHRQPTATFCRWTGIRSTLASSRRFSRA